MKSLLFSPFTIKQLQLKNRIVMSPMCQYSAVNGYTSDWHVTHYITRAIGGVGLIMMEATAVNSSGRISPYDLGIWSDDHIHGLQNIIQGVHNQETKIGIQLAHAGRKGSYGRPWEGNLPVPEKAGGWKIVAPSEVTYDELTPVPHALKLIEIHQIITQFKDAASRAVKAGFDLVEIHAAHGYLLHQFLSPISNQRTDEYGGSFDNRCRLLLEIVEQVRVVVPESKPLFVRLSATDWVENGWNIEDTIQLAVLLKLKGVDFIDTSSGGLSPKQHIILRPGYQVRFSNRIRREAQIATGAVGLITSARQAENILTDGNADLIFLGRELLRNPYFPLQAANELCENIAWPVQYARAK